MKFKIRIDTLTDAKMITEIASRIDERITLEDNNGHIVNGKSLLGAIYSMEFNEIWCCCNKDVSSRFNQWIINE